MKLFLDSENINAVSSIQQLPKGIIEVDQIVDLLNADLNKRKGVIWNGTDIASLFEIVPKKLTYGWAIASIVIPFYIRIEKISDLQKYETIEFDGVVSSSLEVLLNIKKSTNE
jgi:hypothetical protein